MAMHCIVLATFHSWDDETDVNGVANFSLELDQFCEAMCRIGVAMDPLSLRLPGTGAQCCVS